MNTDDKIRAILQMEADAVEPSAAGYDAIRTGIAARRRRTWWTRGSAFAGAVVATAAALVVFSSDPSPQSIDQPPTTTSPGVSSSPSVSPPPTSAAHPDTDPLGTVWPLTTYGELRAWQSDNTIYPSLASPSGSATGFMRAYLLVGDGTLVPKGEDDGAFSFEVHRDTLTVSTLLLRGFGAGGTAPYLVVGASNGAVVVRSPEPGATAASPLKVGGEFNTVDPSILVRLRADGSGTPGFEELGDEHAITGPPNRWDAELAYTTTARTGSIMVTLASLKDEGIAAATVVPVVFAPPTPNQAQTYVGVRDQRLTVLNATDGTLVRYLTEQEPGGGAYHPDVSPNGERVAWSQGAGTCAAVVRFVPITGGEPVNVTSGDGGTVAAMPTWVGNDKIAYAATTCDSTGEKTTLRLYDIASRTDRALRSLPMTPTAMAAGPDGKNLVWIVNGVATRYDVATGTSATVAPTEECEWRGVDVAGTATTGKPILVAVEKCLHATTAHVYRFAADAPGGDLVAEVALDAVMYRIEYDHPSDAMLITHGVEDAPSYVERIGRDGRKTVAGSGVNDAGW